MPGFAYLREIRRADALDEQLEALNKVIIEKMMPALEAATSVVRDSQALIAGMQTQKEIAKQVAIATEATQQEASRLVGQARQEAAALVEKARLEAVKLMQIDTEVKEERNVRKKKRG